MQKLLKAIYSEDKLQQLFQKLKKSTLSLKEFSWPMIPYVGYNYEESDPKLLFVGKVAYGWGDKNSNLKSVVDGKVKITSVMHEAYDFIINKIMPYYSGNYSRKDVYSSSRLMQRIYVISCAAFDCTKSAEYLINERFSEMVFKSIAWTNLFKICLVDGNEPSHAMKSFLLANFNYLDQEIKLLQPDFVIFSTGTTLEYDNYLRRDTFSNYDIQFRDIYRRIVEVFGLNMKSYRTIHFQRMSQKQLEFLCDSLRKRS